MSSPKKQKNKSLGNWHNVTSTHILLIKAAKDPVLIQEWGTQILLAMGGPGSKDMKLSLSNIMGRSDFEVGEDRESSIWPRVYTVFWRARTVVNKGALWTPA